MEKKDILLFGVLLQADIFEEGYGSTEEDGKLMETALKKAFDVENKTDEEKIAADIEIQEILESLLKEYREKITEYVKN